MRPFPRRLTHALSCLAPALLIACAAPATSTRDSVARVSGRSGESQAERYYRRGVDCMDEFDRPDCALDNLEQVVSLNPNDRALTGDAIFRLIKLYKRAGEQERLTQLIRKYWELGKKRNDASALSYGVQSFPRDLTTLAVFDIERLKKSRMLSILGEGLLEYRLTCDEERRDAMEYEAWLAVSVDEPDLQGLEDAALREAFEAAKEARRVRRRQNERGRDGGDEDSEQAVPITSAICDVFAALGIDSFAALDRVTFAGRHDDSARSLVSVELRDIEALLQAGVASGALTQHSDRRWSLDGVLIGDEPVTLVQVDSDEVVVTRPALAAEVEQARATGKPTWSKELKKLAMTVPSDSCFFFVADEEVLRWGMDNAGPLAALLPKPQGLVAAAATYEHAGFFVRLHTPERFKASALVWLAQKILEGKQEDGADDSDQPAWIEDMDVALAPKGGDVIFGVTMSPAQARPMFEPSW